MDVLLSGRGSRDRGLELVTWENDELTLPEAIELCKELNNASAKNIKSNPWMSFDMSVVYKDVSWWLDFHPSNSTINPFDELAINTTTFVNQYKEKKLKYFTKV